MGSSLLRAGDRTGSGGMPPAAAPSGDEGRAPQRPPLSLPLFDPSGLLGALAALTAPIRGLRHLVLPATAVALWAVWFHRFDLLRHAERMTQGFAVWQHLLFGVLSANLLGKLAQ